MADGTRTGLLIRVLSPSRQPASDTGSGSDGTSNGHSAYFLLAVTGWVEYTAAVTVCLFVYLFASSCAASSAAPAARIGPPVIQPVPAAWYTPSVTQRKGTGLCHAC